MVMNRIIKMVAAAAVVAMIPSAAWAVNVSSNSGSGAQKVTTGYAHGFKATGTLKSTSGHKVYYAGLVVYNYYTDEECGRYTSNTTSTSAVSIGGTCSDGRVLPPTADAAKFRVCRDRTGLPDTCGSWSSKDNF